MLSEEQKQDYIKKGNYQYYGYKVLSATIDTSSLASTNKGIVWNPSSINKGKLCNYTVTLSDKRGANFNVEGQLEIFDIVKKKQKNQEEVDQTNPALILRDISTNVVAGMDLEIQTSSFLNLNHQDTVMSKVLGCAIHNNRERKSLLHCAIPTIHNYYEPIYPSLYMILSDKSIYVGITYRDLSERIYEHCTYNKKANKTTFEVLAHENAQVYCIGEFHDYTITEIEAMSEEDRKDFHHKMESVETLMITLASKHCSNLELVNKKQVLSHVDRDKENNKIINHLANLPFINVSIDWYLLVQLGFKIPIYQGVKVTGIASIDYDDEKMQCYVPLEYHEEYVAIINKHKDIRHLDDDYYIDYSLFAFLLLPHVSDKQQKYMFDKLSKKMERLDKREVKYIYFDTIDQQLMNDYKQAKGKSMSSDEVQGYLNWTKPLYDNRHLYKFVRL